MSHKLHLMLVATISMLGIGNADAGQWDDVLAFAQSNIASNGPTNNIIVNGATLRP